MAHEATDSIRSLVDEGDRNKSTRQYGAHKRPAVDSPQQLEPSTLDSPYGLVLEPEVLEPMTLLRI